MAVSKLAPIATKVIYEDEYVRVWNQVVPAGGTIKKHAHKNDYFLLNVTGNGPIEVDFHEGTGPDSRRPPGALSVLRLTRTQRT